MKPEGRREGGYCREDGVGEGDEGYNERVKVNARGERWDGMEKKQRRDKMEERDGVQGREVCIHSPLIVL